MGLGSSVGVHSSSTGGASATSAHGADVVVVGDTGDVGTGVADGTDVFVWGGVGTAGVVDWAGAGAELDGSDSDVVAPGKEGVVVPGCANA